VSTLPASTIDRRARKRLRRHFWPTHFRAEVLTILSFFALWAPANLGHFAFFACAGLSGMALGLSWRWFRTFNMASQAEFDHIAEADYAFIEQVALQSFALEPDELRFPDPAKFRNPATKRDIGQAFKGAKFGTDEKMRRTPHEFMIVHFGHGHLFMFGCVWDLTTGTTIEEWMFEFAYRDIASVELTHKKQTIPVNLKTRELVPLWKKHGIVPLNRELQVPTEESVALRLVTGDVIPIFEWSRSGAGIPSGEGFKSYRAARLMQARVRQLKHRTPPAVRPTPPPVPPTIRHMRSSSS
jgi:hypothetical protein